MREVHSNQCNCDCHIKRWDYEIDDHYQVSSTFCSKCIYYHASSAIDEIEMMIYYKGKKELWGDYEPMFSLRVPDLIKSLTKYMEIEGILK